LLCQIPNTGFTGISIVKDNQFVAKMERAMSNHLTQKHDFSGEFHLATKKQIIDR